MGEIVTDKVPALQQLIRDLPPKPFFRVDEVAKLFQVTPKTVYNWCDLGLLLSVNPSGGSLRIFRHSVVDLVKKKLEEKVMK